MEAGSSVCVRGDAALETSRRDAAGEQQQHRMIEWHFVGLAAEFG